MRFETRPGGRHSDHGRAALHVVVAVATCKDFEDIHMGKKFKRGLIAALIFGPFGPLTLAAIWLWERFFS